jgi:hypothetical protein
MLVQQQVDDVLFGHGLGALAGHDVSFGRGNGLVTFLHPWDRPASASPRVRTGTDGTAWGAVPAGVQVAGFTGRDTAIGDQQALQRCE